MANSKKGFELPKVVYDCRLDARDHKKLIIEVHRASGTGGRAAEVSLDCDEGEFSFVISDKALKKLGVCILRYFKGEEGLFYEDEFIVSSGSAKERFPASEILDQYPL